jgi:hypothetical protein
MIRFACATCGKSLRAPDPMSGRKGRCAHCGAVNMVPVLVPDVLTVEVRRATGAPATPFRDPDEPVRGTIQASVVIAQGSRVLSNAPITAEAGAVGQPRDFFDHVASRLTGLGEPFSADRAAPGAGQNRARVEMEEAVELPGERLREHVAASPVVVAAAPEPRSAVAVALGIGVAIGFCVGIVVGKWLM